MKGSAIAIAIAVWFVLASDAHAARRYALVVGANVGDSREQVLRYAESDAHRLAEVLRSAGDFAPKDTLVLTDASANEVRRALIEPNARIREATDETMLFVFYTGHADGSLHLDGSRLPLEEFRDLVAGSSATTRLLVIDACRSGTLTRVKGGKPGPGFAVAPPPLPISARGLAILASSAAFEDAQESDALRGSFFTHYFVSALRGAADENRDDRVTLSEAYNYTSERTLAATAVSVEGPQHPTYRFELGGHNDLVLTQLSVAKGRLGFLKFDTPGEYFVKEGDEAGAPVAEIAIKRGAVRHVVVPEGSYHISRRSSDHLLQGTFKVARGSTTAVDTDDMQRLAYARVVRKGGTAETVARSIYTVGGVRGSLLGQGTAWHAGLGGRIDLSNLSIELRFQAGTASKANERITIDTRELGGSAIAVRGFDLGSLTLAAGIEVGGFWLAQHFADPQTPDRATFGAVLGPIGIAELPIGRWYMRGELAALTYILRVGNEAGMDDLDTPLTPRVALGAGVYF